MNKKQARKLFDKYLKNECSPREIEMLEIYLESFQNKKELWAELKYEEEIKDKIWLKIRTEISNKKNKNKFYKYRYLKYAALFVGIVGGLLWYQFAGNQKVRSESLISDSEVILKNADNTFSKIDSDSERQLLDKSGKIIANQKGNQIRYDHSKAIQELVYNEILVPNGKTFQLILSDGTFVHINSGSSLKYPVSFLSGEERRVFLEGEAYFEATKNKQERFLVTTKDMEIEVLGTHFNVSSYKDAASFALLAEGSVAVYNQIDSKEERSPTIINPGEKASLAQNKIEVNIVNVSDYLSWRDGRLTFNNEPFHNIIGKIERHYGVVIKNNYKALNPTKFRGRFKKEETIIDVLDTFKESAGFEYEVQQDKIIIKRMEK